MFVVKHRSQHSCKSAIYFDSNVEIIKENCEFQYYYNKTDINPSVLDGGNEIILANWPKTKCVVCKDNHEYPIKIPRHPYVLLKILVLCNCDIYLETIMKQSLVINFATNCNHPTVNTIEQDTQQDVGPSRQESMSFKLE